MTDKNNDRDKEPYPGYNNPWTTDEELAGFDDLELGLEDVTLGGLFGGGDDPETIVDELLAIDELEESHVEELLTRHTVAELVEANIHELLDVPTIGPTEAAAVIEWGEEKDLEEQDDPDNAENAGEEPGSEGVTPGVEAVETGEDGPASRTAAELLEDGTENGANTSSSDHALDEHPQNDPEGDALGESIGYALVWPFAAIASLLGSVAYGASQIIPKRTSVYRKMIKLGYKGIYKKTGAHVVTNTIYGDGEMVPRKGSYDSEEQTLETSNGEWWTASSGLQPVFIGDVPIVHGVADHHELVDPIAARIAETVDLGPQRYQEVERTPQGFAPAAGNTNGGAAAATDGGAASAGLSSTFDDVWLDVSNPVEENDGMIVSLEKAYELHWDQGSSEEMENQETRGMLAVMDPRSDRKKALMYVLLFAGGIALGMFGPGLAQSIAPGTEGGSPISLWLSGVL